MNPIHPEVARDYKLRRFMKSPYHQLTMQMLESFLKHLGAAKRTIPDDAEYRRLYNRFMKFVLSATARGQAMKRVGITDEFVDGHRIVRAIQGSGIRTGEVQLELKDLEKVQRLVKKITRQDNDPLDIRVQLALKLLEFVAPQDLFVHPLTIIQDFESLFRATQRWIPGNANELADIVPDINIVKYPEPASGFEKTGQWPETFIRSTR